jgi:quinol monooxygenase YgiN
MPVPIVYIDRSDIREGKLDEVRAAIHDLVEFVDAHEPQLISYSFYMDAKGTGMTVVAIHPDSASLEFHMEIAGPVFRKFTDLIKLRTIEVYGRPSRKVLNQLQQKAEMLGENASVVVQEQHGGFMRLASATP